MKKIFSYFPHRPLGVGETWKERQAVAADLWAIYGAATLPEAEAALERFAERWDTQSPAMSPSWLADPARDRPSPHPSPGGRRGGKKCSMR
jgi:hypothetical protein